MASIVYYDIWGKSWHADVYTDVVRSGQFVREQLGPRAAVCPAPSRSHNPVWLVLRFDAPKSQRPPTLSLSPIVRRKT